MGGQAGDSSPCEPKTCASEGFNRGDWNDGRGRMLDCGTCDPCIPCGDGTSPCCCRPVTPTAGLPGLNDLLIGDAGSGGTSSLAAVAGYPSITVPSGLLHGLPLGLLFTGGRFSEATLLSLAFAYGQGTRRRQRPRFLPTINAA
jgi:hypothetical protein